MTDSEKFLALLLSPYMEHSEEEGCIAFTSILKREDQAKRSLVRTSKKSTHGFWEEAQEDGIPDWYALLEKENKEGADIYFGSAIRSFDFLHQRGNSRGALPECVASTAFIIDFDLKGPAHKADNLPATLEDLEEILAGRPDPSIVIHSGYGVHAYWLYKEPVFLSTKKERLAYNRRRQSLQEVYRSRLAERGWQLDATYTTDRIWRLPGFINHKIEGQTPTVDVLYGIDEDPITYDVEEIYQGIEGEAKARKVVDVKATVKPEYKRPEGAFSREDLDEALKERKLTRRAILLQKKDLTEGLADLPGAIVFQAKKYHDDSRELSTLHDIQEAETKSIYLSRLILGESLDDKGNRDHALTRVCGLISFLTPNIVEFSEEDLRFIVEDLMGASLACWAEDDDDTDLEREFEKAIEKLSRIKEKDSAARDEPLERMREVFRKRHSFLEAADEEGLLGDGSELSKEDLEKRGLLIFKDYTYVYDHRNQGYFETPARNRDYLAGIIRKCWPADDPNCPHRWQTFTADGMIEVPLNKLKEVYGTAAKKAYYSFLVPQTTYLEEDDAIVVNPAPLRYTDPRYDENIDEWLKLLGGEHYEKICDWLAASLHLDHPCAALYFNGPPGCGKSLFAQGVASLYSKKGAASFEEVAGHFNDALKENPICVVDEVISMREERASAILRRLITTNHHDVNVKHGLKLSIESYIRIIIAANNDAVLMNGREERLSEADATAVAERIFYVKVNDNKARDFFLEKGTDMPRSWISDGLFARHILWLAQNRKLDKSRRFLVTGESSDMHKKITYQGTERNRVWEWLTLFAEAPAIVNGRVKKEDRPAVIGDGILAVCAQFMRKHFDVFDEDSKIERNNLNRQLAAICGKDKPVQVWVKLGEGRVARRYWPIPVEKILDYANDNDIGDLERIETNAKNEDEVTQQVKSSKQ